MGKALYRKYRSKSLDELVGQEHITRTLSQALKNGHLSHAYLFTGPRGVGKTSVARILAHAVNKLPYDEETPHIDIIEIDAASNRRIEEIRDLRDKVHITPTSATYKVYIIDEVHMLTREAFNALLKTLEEPPAHVIFILATTEPHKLPETIISRTQRFSFKPIDSAQAVKHLRSLAKKENIDINDDALQLIAEHGGGSFRDSISLLDQARNLDKKITKPDIEQLLGLAPTETIAQLYTALANGTAKDIIAQLEGLREQGFGAASIAKQLAARLRDDLIEGKASLGIRTTTALLSNLLEVSAAQNPDSFLELTLLEPVLQRQPEKTSAKVEAGVVVEKVPPQEELKTPATSRPTQAQKVDGSITEAWPNILTALRKQHNTLYGIVRMAEPLVSDDHLTLKFAFPFHQKRLSEAKNQDTLRSIITEVTGQAVRIECIIDKQAQPPQFEATPEAAPSDPSLDTISNIFGGAELLD